LRTADCLVSTPSRARKKIQTPIKSSIGNHEVQNETGVPLLGRGGLERLLWPGRGRS
jgi:hypothetical protein